jgi:hypothetical protein
VDDPARLPEAVTLHVRSRANWGHTGRPRRNSTAKHHLANARSKVGATTTAQLEKRPAFAVEAGQLALHWLAAAHAYEINGADVWAAHDYTIKAAQRTGGAADVRTRIRQIVGDGPGGLILQILGRELEP